MRPSSRRTVASAGRHRFGDSGSGRTPRRSRTDGGASVIHSPTASREVAPARTAHPVNASTRPERAVRRADREGRAPRAVAPAGPGSPRERSRDARGIGQRQAGSAMMPRRARSSTRITGRRELHGLGSPCLSRSQNPVELTDRHESGVKATTAKPWLPAQRRTPALPRWKHGDLRWGGHVRRSRSSTRTVRCRSTGIYPTGSGRCCG